MKRRNSDKARQKQMDSLRDLAIFAIEPIQGKRALNELALQSEEALPRLIEIATSFKTDTEVRVAAKYLVEKFRLTI